MSIISSYLGPIHSAVLVFPLLALILAFPYIMYEYRHYGAIPLIRTIIVYTLILYLICAFFEVILPLPSRSEVASSSAPAMQMQPGNFLQIPVLTFPQNKQRKMEALCIRLLLYS